MLISGLRWYPPLPQPPLQDALEILESWLTLMQQCPRHFRLSKGVLQALATYALPAAGVCGGGEGGMPCFQPWQFARHVIHCCDAARRAALCCHAFLLTCALLAACQLCLQ